MKEEHKVIVRQLATIERRVNAGGLNGRRFSESTAALGMQLQKHFAYEEREVYQPLNLKLKRSSPTKELTEDHRAIWKAFGMLRRASLTEGPGAAAAAELKSRLSSLRLGLSEHFEKEEKIVIWLADCLL